MTAIAIAGSTMGGAINGGNVTLTYPSGTNVVRNYALVNVTLGTSKATTLAVASSSGAAFSQIVATIQSSSVRFGVFRRFIASTGETQCTITGTGGSTDSTCAVIHVFSGVDLNTPEDVAATSTNGGSANPDSPSITVASCGDAIVTSVGIGLSAITLTAPTSFLDAATEFSTDTHPSGAGQAWVLNNTSAAFNPAAWTSSLSGTWTSATIALRRAFGHDQGAWALVDSSAYVTEEARKTVIRSY